MAKSADSKVQNISGDATRKIKWDDSKMKSSYANVCNVSSTREEVILFFGISNPTQTPETEVTIQLSDRVILSPFAAKRLSALLTNVIEQYESRFSKLSTEPPAPVSVSVSKAESKT